jgi:hypothetical protein
MLRRIITGTAVAGALTLSLAGAASAAPAAPSASGAGKALASAKGAALCKELPKIESQVQKFGGALSAWVLQEKALAATANSAGHAKLAHTINGRIANLQRHDHRLGVRLRRAEAKCSSVAPKGESGTTGSTTG